MRRPIRRSDGCQATGQLLVTGAIVRPVRRKSRGFTLIEMMTVITIMTLLVAIAVPNMRSLIANQRAQSAAYDLISDLALARSEAVKRNKDVALSPSSGWTEGWTIKTVGTGEVVGQRNPLGGGVQVTRSPSGVTYDGSGRLSGAVATVRFEVFDGYGSYRCITLDPSGQPSTKTKTCP